MVKFQLPSSSAALQATTVRRREHCLLEISPAIWATNLTHGAQALPSVARDSQPMVLDQNFAHSREIPT